MAGNPNPQRARRGGAVSESARLLRGQPWFSLEGARVRLGGRDILKEISWQWRTGEHWVLCGETGAGKSTFLKLVAGAVSPNASHGEPRLYRMDGETFAAPAGMGSRIVLFSPEKHLRHARLGAGLTVREALLSGFEDRDYVFCKPSPAQRARALEIAETLELTPLLGRKTDTLSQGQLRRTLLGRALVARPFALLLDEAGQGLDGRARALLQKALARAAKEGTRILCATHRFDECGAWANRWLRLQSGRIAARGTGLPLGALAPDEKRAIALLRNVYLALRVGEHTLIEGENGAGKSSLLKLIYGDLTCAKGGFVERFLGARESLFLPEARPRIGFLSAQLQQAIDPSQTLAQAVASGFTASLGVWRARRGGAFKAAHKLLREWGLGGLARRRLADVSFGQARLALLGRAVVRRPQLLLLDEPFDGLSPRERAAMRARLCKLAKAGTTLALATHHPAEAPNLAFRRVRVKNGRVFAEGGA